MRSTYPKRKTAELFANSGDPDQTPRSAASDLGLHCLPIILLRVYRLKWVKNDMATRYIILDYWRVTLYPLALSYRFGL